MKSLLVTLEPNGYDKREPLPSRACVWLVEDGAITEYITEFETPKAAYAFCREATGAYL